MARLNEPINESIESLKRRFVRQNRELARVNSSQSIKIRTLETEISRLLSENVLLRERNIQLEADLDDVRTRDIRSGVDTIRNKMDSKMQEIHSLLADLANLNKKPRRRKSQFVPAQQTAMQPHQKASLSGGSSMNLQDCQLPTIVEGKHFPRRTLEPQEIESIVLAERSDSSEIGPPPKTFFGSEGIKEEQALQLNGPTSDSTETDLTDLLLANFETRRRRRNSHLRQVASVNGNDEIERLLVPPVRIGSKRKLSIRDHKENEPEIIQETSSASLSSIREAKDAKSPRKQFQSSGEANCQHNQTYQLNNTEKGSTGLASSPRKVLGTKPVNTDPIVSPKKIPKQNPAKQMEKAIKSSIDGAPRGLSSRGSAKSKPKSTAIEIPAALSGPPPSVTDIFIESSKCDPETPAARIDVFSPESAQTSEQKAESDITARVTASEGPAGPGRVSRRARAVVSYTEPNLVSKMRRPSKGLVDAVIAGQGRKSGSTFEDHSQASEDTSENNPGTRLVHLHKDSASDQRWKPAEQEKKSDLSRPEPTSPLVSKETSGTILDVSRPVATKKRPRPASSSSIPVNDTGTSSLEKEFTSLDIFDVQDSPPRNGTASTVRTKSQVRRQTIGNTTSSSSSSSSPAEPSDLSRSKFSQRSVSASQGIKHMRSVNSMSSSSGSHGNSAVGSAQGVERRRSMML